MKKLNKILQTYNKVNLKLKEASFNTARADLKYAEKGANLEFAKLQYANLEYGANLTEVDLDFAKTLLKIKRGI